MQFALLADLLACVEQRVRKDGFASPSEFIAEAARSKMEVTDQDLKGVRSLLFG